MKKFLKIFVIITLLFSSTVIYATSSTNGNGGPQNGGGMMQGQSGPQQNGQGQPQNMNNQKPMIMGTVTDIDDDTITIESIKMGGPKSEDSSDETVTYTVDASDTTVYEDQKEASLSDIDEGDKIMVEGTISGTKITATKIHIDDLKGSAGITDGTGEPVVMGTVTDIGEDDETIEIENNGDTIYTVDLSDATILKDGEEIDISDIEEDDVVLVQGEADGSEITASTVTIQVNDNSTKNQNTQKIGFFQRIGNFFSKLFGF